MSGVRKSRRGGRSSSERDNVEDCIRMQSWGLRNRGGGRGNPLGMTHIW